MSEALNKGLLSSLLLLSALCIAPRAQAVTSAELVKTEALRYGRFQARVWFSAGDGIVGSFFLWKSGSEKPGTYWNELDFEKIKADCSMQLNSIYGNPKVDHVSFATVPGGACSGYHTYTFEWTPESVTWFVDGTQVRQDTGAGAKAYADNATQGMQIDFNIWPGTPAFGGTFSESSLPVHQYVSWVEYWAHTPGAGTDGGNFTLKWRESFEQNIPRGWSTGTWPSPLGQSTHATANVKVVNGIAVLSLTADNAKGFSGTPPADSEDKPTVTATGAGGTGSGGTTSAGGATNNAGGSAGAVNNGGSSVTGGSSGESSDPASDDGCSCRVPTGNAPSWGFLAGSVALLLGLARRRRTR